MTSLAILPVDVLGQTLMQAPDFGTLTALAATCHSLRDAYNAHTQSTRRAVAKNVCGPGWPRALLAVYAGRARDVVDAEMRTRWIEARRASAEANGQEPDSTDDEDDDSFWDEWEDEDARRPALWITPELPSEDEMRTTELSLMDMRELDILGPTTRLAERVFSQRFCDMTAPGSVLSPEETLKFHNALYLHEVFARAWGQRTDREENLPPSDWRARTAGELAFLKTYSTSELRALRAVRLFIVDVHDWACAASTRGYWPGPPSRLDANSSTLAMIVRLCQYPVVHRDGKWPFRAVRNKLAQDPLTAMSRARNLKPDVLEFTTVDDIFGVPASNLCDHCHVYSGPRLYTESTWPYLQGDLMMHRIGASLPGQLSSNEYLRSPLAGIWNNLALSSTDIVRSMFALHGSEGGWDAAHRLCVNCVLEFVKEHIVRWCRQELVSRGETIPDDNCWYGWNCRTQTHSPAHAEKLNHLCVPTRGD